MDISAVDSGVSPRPASHPPVDEPAGELGGSPILLVDDNEANLIALRAVLGDLGEPIVCARNGEEALRWVLKQDFAVILLDVLMPGMDGYETAMMIRSRKKSQDIPIIFLSAVNKDPAHLFRGYSAGAVDYVFKPFEPLILRSKVSVFIELHRKAQAILRQAEHERQLMAENIQVRMAQTRTAEALQRSEARLSLMIELLPVALYASSAANGFRSRQFVGGNVEELCGFGLDELNARSDIWLSRVHEDDRPAIEEALVKARQTGVFSAEYRWHCADGTVRWLSDRGVLSRQKDQPDGMYGIWLDISERRALEQQLVHSQKLESVGQLTGGIAHDFNNMLSVILGSLERVDQESIDDAKVRRRIDLALQAAHSCAELTRQLLGFARRQALEPRSVAPSEQLESLKGLLKRTLGASISFVVDDDPGVWPIYVDASQFEATLLNLAINARDAMPKGGTLTLRLENRPERHPSLDGLDLKPGDYVEIVVADTGTGMSEEVRQKAFEPFFTTKAKDKGTGLGLSTIHGFIKQSGGAVRIESELGRGTEIHLFLPRAASVSAAETSDGAPVGRSPDRLRGCKVLVVEDDEKVRETTVGMLQEFGCRTVEAGDAEKALSVIDRGDDIQFVLTDCVMPGGMNGPELAEVIAERRPELPILFTSGYSEELRALKKSGKDAAFLAKPYTACDLANAMAKLFPAEGSADSPSARMH